MNEIHKKVMSLDVVNSVFIHPLSDARETLEENVGGSLYSFAVGEVVYLIESLKVSSMMGCESSYTLFVQQGNVWHESRVKLFEWEWTCLVHGYEMVNNNQYYAHIIRKTQNVECYVSKEDRKAEIESWKEKVKTGEAEESMIDFITSAMKPAVLTENGEWIVNYGERIIN